MYGSQKYAVRIQLDPQQLAARSIGIDEVATAVQNGNVNLPTGILWGTDKAYSVRERRPAHQRGRTSARWWWRSATAPRCGWRTSAG